MNKRLGLPALAVSAVFGLGWSSALQAQEVGRVISSTPITQQVAVPRQVCTQQPVVVRQHKSGAGALIGAIVGGALGHSIGSGGGRAAATMLGAFGGAVIGDQIEDPAAASVQHVQTCTTQTFYEHRTSAYAVVYEYAGKQYSVQMPYDPGPYVRLQVTPAADAWSTYEQRTSQLPAPAPLVATQTAVTYLAPTYDATYPNYAPVGLGVGLALGYTLHHGHRGHHHHHRHWR